MLCCAKPAVTAFLRSLSNDVIAALFAEMFAPGEPGPVSGYFEFGADGVSVMNVRHGGTPPALAPADELFQ